MKKGIVFILAFLLCVSVQARSKEPKFEIIANSNQETDIKQMYDIKYQLLNDYKDWVKGVDNKEQVLADHQSDYHASFKQGVYKIILGKGKGKSLTGDLKVSYCESTKDIQTKSLFFDWLF